MEEAIRKQGLLFLQQHKFGKKWKKVWGTLYRESSCSISRLEFFECKDGGTLEKCDRTLKKQQENKKVIKLSDCIRVTEVDAEGSPRDCSPFLVETTDKIYTFSCEPWEREDWVHRLCETAFPVKRCEAGAKKSSGQQKSKKTEEEEEEEEEEEGMEDNSLYSGRETLRCTELRVVVRRTEVSERCRLRGSYLLRADLECLQLRDLKTGSTLFSWPYRFLRRFGRDKVTFSFEAGRRCDSGEGSLEFDTKQGNALFQAVEGAINLQRGIAPIRQTSGGEQEDKDTPLKQHRVQHQHRTQTQGGLYSVVTLQNPQNLPREAVDSSPPQRVKQRPPQAHLEPPVEKRLTGVKSLTFDPWGASPPRKHQVKPIASCPLLQAEHQGAPPAPEPEYSLPFDAVARGPVVDPVTSQLGVEPQGEGRRLAAAADPLYDSIDESAVRAGMPSQAKGPRATYQRAEHIYDEPEGRAVIGQTSAAPTSLYDNPDELKGQAWRIKGSVLEPKGHEYPYNPQLDDYAVPQATRKAFPSAMEESPYDNVMVTARNHNN